MAAMKIKTAVIDLDGCLTDGRQYITEDGTKLCKTFNSRDRMAIRRILSSGVNVLVVSADDWLGGKAWVESIEGDNGRKAEFWHTRKKHELPLDWETCIGIGDDIEDQPFLEKCELAFCPKDADPRLGTPTITELPIAGGQGVMCYLEAEIQLLNENIVTHALYY